MMNVEKKYMERIDTRNWYDKYKGLPYKHLGNSTKTGIDCINLCFLVYRNELGINIPYEAKDFATNEDPEWYNQMNHENPLKHLNDPKWGWVKVKDLKCFDIVTMSIGSTNITNHAALYVGEDKLLHIMVDKVSWIAPYGKYYKNYTVGKYRWKGI